MHTAIKEQFPDATPREIDSYLRAIEPKEIDGRVYGIPPLSFGAWRGERRLRRFCAVADLESESAVDFDAPHEKR